MQRSMIKSPRLASWLLARMIEPEIRLGALGDLDEQFHKMVDAKGRVKARISYWFQLFVVLPGFVKNWIIWRIVMFKNYFKVAYRNIRRSKGYSFINIVGLAVGITCCLLIMLYVLDELSYDRFYPNADRIYRVANYGVVNDRIDHTARSSPPVSQTLEEEFPEVEAITKCRNYGFPVFRYQEKVFSE
jgi:putative ABC transport system permease protein